MVRGLSFRDAGGKAVKNRDEILRIKELAIPPAWKDVWIWNATILAAVSLAVDGRDAGTQRARRRAIDGAMELWTDPTTAGNRGSSGRY